MLAGGGRRRAGFSEMKRTLLFFVVAVLVILASAALALLVGRQLDECGTRTGSASKWTPRANRGGASGIFRGG